jgi:hypothetical protein
MYEPRNPFHHALALDLARLGMNERELSLKLVGVDGSSVKQQSVNKWKHRGWAPPAQLEQMIAIFGANCALSHVAWTDMYAASPRYATVQRAVSPATPQRLEAVDLRAALLAALPAHQQRYVGAPAGTDNFSRKALVGLPDYSSPDRLAKVLMLPDNPESLRGTVAVVLLRLAAAKSIAPDREVTLFLVGSSHAAATALPSERGDCAQALGVVVLQVSSVAEAAQALETTAPDFRDYEPSAA